MFAFKNIFLAANLVVMPFWLVLLLAPRWRYTKLVARYQVGPMVLAAVYAILVLPDYAQILPDLLKPELYTMMEYAVVPKGFTVLWMHILAFDLAIANWMLPKAQEAGMGHGLFALCAFLTLMMGPVGLAVFMVSRSLLPKKASTL